MAVVMLGVSKKLWSSVTSFMTPFLVANVAPPTNCLRAKKNNKDQVRVPFGKPSHT